MALQVSDEAAGLAHPACPGAIADPGGALDILVRAHVVDQRDETVIEHGEVAAENLFGR